MATWLLYPLFFIVALLYAAIGFGGGSSYLALLSLTSIDYDSIRTLALVSNVAVVSGNVWVFFKHKQLNFKSHFHFFLLSIPFAFLGGSIRLQEQTFFFVLAISLILAAFAIWFQTKESAPKATSKSVVQQLWFRLLLGGAVGLLSGLVGIGGGIFLSPLLHLLRYDKAKPIAAISSLFILANSLAGLAGQYTSVTLNVVFITYLPLVLVVIVAGQIGVRFSAVKLNDIFVKRATALLVFSIGCKLLMKYL